MHGWNSGNGLATKLGVGVRNMLMMGCCVYSCCQGLSSVAIVPIVTSIAAVRAWWTSGTAVSSWTSSWAAASASSPVSRASRPWSIPGSSWWTSITTHVFSWSWTVRTFSDAEIHTYLSSVNFFAVHSISALGSTVNAIKSDEGKSAWSSISIQYHDALFYSAIPITNISQLSLISVHTHAKDSNDVALWRLITISYMVASWWSRSGSRAAISFWTHSATWRQRPGSGTAPTWHVSVVLLGLRDVEFKIWSFCPEDK